MTNPGLETKRFHKLMGVLDECKALLERFNGPHQITVTPHRGLLWGIWTLVVIEAARLGLYFYY
jgi:hypothetical protein